MMASTKIAIAIATDIVAADVHTCDNDERRVSSLRWLQWLFCWSFMAPWKKDFLCRELEKKSAR